MAALTQLGLIMSRSAFSECYSLNVILSLPLFFTDAFPDALNSAGLLNGVWKPATEATITAEVLLLGII